MPGDSLLINNKATAQNTYDAIVIGSGISGGWAAKELTEKGLRVLMLEEAPNWIILPVIKRRLIIPGIFHTGAQPPCNRKPTTR